MNRFRLAALAAAMVLAAASSASTQTPQTPTTRTPAIWTLTSNADMQLAKRILPSEVHDTVRFCLEGKMEQLYSLQDRTGVAFILNVTDPAAAHAMLEKLPLGQAHLMTFEPTPLGPLNRLLQLQGTTTGSP